MVPSEDLGLNYSCGSHGRNAKHVFLNSRAPFCASALERHEGARWQIQDSEAI